MAPLRVLNRGFGGAPPLPRDPQRATRRAPPTAPRAVVVYAGDNDLAAGTGKTVADVVGDFRTLVGLLHEARPDLPVYFVAIKPSTLRWERWPEMERANGEIAAIAAADPRITLLDIASPMLESTGGAPPPDDLFLLDGLHLSEAGYAIWTDVIRGALLADLGAG